MSRIALPLALGLLATFTAPALGQFTLKKVGGGVTQLTTLSIGGAAGTPYLLLFSPVEAPTLVKPGVTLEIPLTYAGLAASLPGFVGQLSGAGAASVSFVIPNDPLLLDLVISFQVIGGAGLSQTSNLVRLTPALPGSFEPTLNDAALPVSGGAAIERDDGTVLLVGGSGPLTQIYDSNREEFELGGPAFGVGLLGQSTALADGRILFTGGLGADGQPTDAAALFDPVTLTTTNLTMASKRAGHGATLMPNGKVLVTGGFAALDLTDVLALLLGIQGGTEVFDPATLAFTAGPVLLEPRALHTSTLTSTGRVLIAGGLTIIPIVSIPTVSNTAYAFNPSTNSFGLPIFFSGPRLMHSAVALNSGKVLLVGGLTADFSAVLTSGDLTQLAIGTLADGQVFTPSFFGGTFATISGLSTPRAGAGVAPLPGGKALIAGGFDLQLSQSAIGLTPLASADVFDGAAFVATSAMAQARALPLLEPLADGTVLVVGGGPLLTEIHQP
jgi:hypothetical protein